jgi:hypothetical protein
MRNGRVGVSGRSGLSRHSGPSGRFVGWRLPVHCRPFAVTPIRRFAHTPHRAPGTGVVDANVWLALAFSDRGSYRASGLKVSGSARLPIDRFLESDPPGLVSMCRTGHRLES